MTTREATEPSTLDAGASGRASGVPLPDNNPPLGRLATLTPNRLGAINVGP